MINSIRNFQKKQKTGYIVMDLLINFKRRVNYTKKDKNSLLVIKKFKS